MYLGQLGRMSRDTQLERLIDATIHVGQIDVEDVDGCGLCHGKRLVG